MIPYFSSKQTLLPYHTFCPAWNIYTFKAIVEIINGLLMLFSLLIIYIFKITWKTYLEI